MCGSEMRKLIPSPRSGQPEKAQIGVNGADQRYRKLRIQNALTDEHGDDVKLKRLLTSRLLSQPKSE